MTRHHHPPTTFHDSDSSPIAARHPSLASYHSLPIVRTLPTALPQTALPPTALTPSSLSTSLLRPEPANVAAALPSLPVAAPVQEPHEQELQSALAATRLQVEQLLTVVGCQATTIAQVTSGNGSVAEREQQQHEALAAQAQQLVEQQQQLAAQQQQLAQLAAEEQQRANKADAAGGVRLAAQEALLHELAGEVPSTHYSLLTTHYSPLTTHHSLLTIHHSPLTTFYLLLTTHYSLLTTPYPLLTADC